MEFIEMSRMNYEQLINLQKIFIEGKDWIEVSSIQYYIETNKLKPTIEKLENYEPWFLAILAWVMISKSTEVYESLKQLEKIRKKLKDEINGD